MGRGLACLWVGVVAAVVAQDACPKWIRPFKNVKQLVEASDKKFLTSELRAIKTKMHDYTANLPSDEYHGEDRDFSVLLPSKDLEELSVCEERSVHCYQGRRAIRAMLRHGRGGERQLEQLDLEKDSWVVPMGHGLWRIDPEQEQSLRVTGVELPPAVPRMNDTSKWSLNETKKLGSGSYKQVYVGRLGSKKVAICKIPPPHGARLFPVNELNYLTFEMRYQMLFHRTKVGGKDLCAQLTPNIFGVHEEKSSDGVKTVFLIREFLDGSLEDVSFKGKATEAVDAAIDMALMLKCLKNGHVLHRDIKPSNYLYRKRDDGSKQLYLQDFGLAANACDDERNPCTKADVDNLHDQCGSGMFMPPETFAEESRYKFDMFSQGITFRELGIAGVTPEMEKVVARMTAGEYADRPTPDELLTMLFDMRLKMARKELEEDADSHERSSFRHVFQKMKKLSTIFQKDASATAFQRKYPKCDFAMSHDEAATLARQLEAQLSVLG